MLHGTEHKVWHTDKTVSLRRINLIENYVGYIMSCVKVCVEHQNGEFRRKYMITLERFISELSWI